MNINELKNRTIFFEDYMEYIRIQKELVIPSKVLAAEELLKFRSMNKTEKVMDKTDTEILKLKLINNLPTFNEWLNVKNEKLKELFIYAPELKNKEF